MDGQQPPFLKICDFGFARHFDTNHGLDRSKSHIGCVCSALYATTVALSSLSAPTSHEPFHPVGSSQTGPGLVHISKTGPQDWWFTVPIVIGHCPPGLNAWTQGPLCNSPKGLMGLRGSAVPQRAGAHKPKSVAHTEQGRGGGALQEHNLRTPQCIVFSRTVKESLRAGQDARVHEPGAAAQHREEEIRGGGGLQEHDPHALDRKAP